MSEPNPDFMDVEFVDEHKAWKTMVVSIPLPVELCFVSPADIMAWTRPVTLPRKSFYRLHTDCEGTPFYKWDRNV